VSTVDVFAVSMSEGMPEDDAPIQARASLVIRWASTGAAWTATRQALVDALGARSDYRVTCH